MAEDIVAVFKAVGQRAFQAAVEGAAGSMGHLEKESHQASKGVEATGRSASKAAPSWKKAAGTLAKWAGGAAALYAAKRGVEASIHTTEDLAKSTLAVQRATGLDAKQASAWAEVMKSRGVETRAMQMGMTKLSTAMNGAANGGKKQKAVFDTLGVSMQSVDEGDTMGVILQTADAFKRLQNPAQKAALAQQLFGRQGIAMLPLLNQGSEGIKEQMGLAEKYGATLSTKTVAGTKEMIARQREMKFAMDGLKISMGTALLPVIEAVAGVMMKLVTVMQPVLRDATLMKVLIGALALAFVAYKVAMIASTIATLGFNAAFLLIPLAIIAVAAGFVLLYNKWGWFHRAVDNTFKWIKSHWPLLLGILTGPFGVAAVLIIKNFGKIRKAASDAVHWVANAFRNLISFFERIPGKIFGRIQKLLSAPVNLASKLVPGHATGGTVSGSGWRVVGETGPEMAHFPTGARVAPLGTLPALGAPALGGMQTTANFWLDRRLVGTAVATDAADQRARR